MPHDRLPRVILGLALALSLAVLAAHPRVRALERRFGVTVLISAGIPFLAMGAIFRLPDVGVLTDDILTDLQPAFEFGLGWIGFVVGMQFDIHSIDNMPAGVSSVVAMESIVPMLTTACLCAIAYLNLGVPFTNVDFVRDALVLAACAAPSAPIAAELWAPRIGARPARLVEEITRIDEVMALVLLGVVAIFFRPPGESTLWRLPSASAWLLVSLGLGVVLGIITYVLIRGAKNASEELAMLLGAVALSAGIAGYLALSVPVVCAIAGALLANLPMRDKKGFEQTLLDVERPLYLVFLVVVGASWQPTEWEGWVLAPAFVLARVAGKRLGAIWATRFKLHQDLPSARHLAIALAPQSPIAIVAIVSAATLYRGYHSDRVRWAINAVIIGGVLTEVVVRILERRGKNALVTPLPIPLPRNSGILDPPIALPGMAETTKQRLSAPVPATAPAHVDPTPERAERVDPVANVAAVAGEPTP